MTEPVASAMVLGGGRRAAGGGRRAAGGGRRSVTGAPPKTSRGPFRAAAEV
ncbi:hypothetical protein [Streptomyces europaeiscabiei]|uniref:hypothetical protein n=1 Tax=Streptomyces europaeiscabiei TaxID=146819 RepID=UPI0038F7B9A1